MATPTSPDVVITSGYQFPASFQAGARIYVEENVKVTFPTLLLNTGCTLILGRCSSVSLGSTNTLTLSDGCSLVMGPGSVIKVASGGKIVFGQACVANFVEGQLQLGDLRASSKKARVIFGKATLVKLGGRYPVTSTSSATFEAPAFDPKSTTQDYVELDAPATQIFDGVEVSGNWRMDRAYPQWFAPKDCSDWSGPINKAIEMKRTGMVYLQKGQYPILSSIKVTYGIELVGEVGVRGYDYKNIKDPYDDEYQDYHGTMIIGAFKGTNQSEAWKNFSYRCMILVNIAASKLPTSDSNNTAPPIKDDMWEKAYPSPSTCIRDLALHNGAKALGGGTEEVVHQLNGIYVAGGAKFENIYFGALKQAIVKSNDYADNMRILNCSFSHDYAFNGPIDTSRYMVHLSGNGDNLVFQGNHFESADEPSKALYIRGCHGGSVVDNIINGEVEIKACNGLTFANNHMEYTGNGYKGPQLRIFNSQISVCGNFFHKSNMNNIVIKGAQSGEPCSVILENNMFLCRYTKVPNLFKDKNKPPTLSQYEAVLEDLISIAQTPELLINPGAEVHMKALYRQIDGVNSITWASQVGIAIQVESYDGPITTSSWRDREARINYLSPFLSSTGCIKPGLNVENLVYTLPNTTGFSVGATDLNAPNQHLYWFAAEGFYEYYAQVVVDPFRKIVGTLNSSDYPKILPVTERKSYFSEKANSAGIRIQLVASGGLSNSGWCAWLYLYRSFRTSQNGQVTKWEIAKIPVSGAPILYDNGLAVSGYAWEELSGTPTKMENAGTGVVAVTHINDNVRCLSTQRPTTLTSTLQRGDLVYNVGTDTSWNLYVKG